MAYKRTKRPGGLPYDPNASVALPRAQERVLRIAQGLAPRELELDRQPFGPVYPRARDRLDLIPRRLHRSPRVARPARLRNSVVFQSLHKLQMRAPSRVLFCLRRKQRKEVLFARGVAGRRGVGRGRRWRRTGDSAYSCVR